MWKLFLSHILKTTSMNLPLRPIKSSSQPVVLLRDGGVSLTYDMLGRSEVSGYMPVTMTFGPQPSLLSLSLFPSHWKVRRLPLPTLPP